MTVDQLPGEVREFASYLDGLMRRLDQGGGWCGVFWQRDPDGMRACLDGWEVPPWDVVEALLQDLGAEYGGVAAEREAGRARSLHGASLAAFDARPGGRDALGDRLDVMLREQRYAAERRTELNRLLAEAATPRDADAVRLDLAWARDDHERATARCVELRHRMENLDRRALRTHASGALGFSGAAGGARRPADGKVRGNRPGEAWAEDTWADDTGSQDTGFQDTGARATETAGRHRAALSGRTRNRSPLADPTAPPRSETADPGPYDPSATTPGPGPEAFTRTGPDTSDAPSAPSRPAARGMQAPGAEAALLRPVVLGRTGRRSRPPDRVRPGVSPAPPAPASEVMVPRRSTTVPSLSSPPNRARVAGTSAPVVPASAPALATPAAPGPGRHPQTPAPVRAVMASGPVLPPPAPGSRRTTPRRTTPSPGRRTAPAPYGPTRSPGHRPRGPRPPRPPRPPGSAPGAAPGAARASPG